MDIRDLDEDQIWNILKRGEKVPYYPDISLPTRDQAVETFGDVLGEEKKLSRTLSKGIAEQKGFHGKTRIPDIVKELSADMGIETPEIEYKYNPRAAGWAYRNEHKIGLNPETLTDFGREGVIAHELRHLKEGNWNPNKYGGHELDKSIRNILYSTPPEIKDGDGLQGLLEGFHKMANYDDAVKKEQGKALNFFIPKKNRLFKNDKLKYSVDAMDAYDFLEKGHFKESFLKKNLQLVAKGLPIIGTAATVAGGLGYSDSAGAAVDYLIPGGVEEMGRDAEQKMLDQKYKERIRSRQESLNKLVPTSE